MSEETTENELRERGIPQDLWRRCVRFGCGQLIGAHRTIRNSVFCSDRCYRLDNNARRAFKATKACRRCGRPAKKAKANVDNPDQNR